MATKDELIGSRKKQLLAMGYKPGIVDLAMEWAHGCAEGMVNYAARAGVDDGGKSREEMIARYLPPYLKDCEKWIRSFGHEPGEVQPPT